MPTTHPAPLCQIRVIGTAEHATTLLSHLIEHARPVLGPHATYRTHTRSARRIGHVRAYLTVTRREPPDEHCPA